MSSGATEYQARCARWYDAGYYRHESLGETLGRAVSARPDTPLHFHTEEGLRSVTAREVLERPVALRALCRPEGCDPGDVFALQLPTSFETATLYVAAFRAGATVLPLVHNLGPGDVDFILRDAARIGSRRPDTWYGQDFSDVSQEFLRSMTSLAGLVIVGERAPRGGVTWHSSRTRRRARAALRRAGSRLALRAALHVGHDRETQGCAAHAQHDPQ